jgi:alkanesulfonate monooxygenase SsuD/methylene tetrahydromethanopterin reductase-like flavin-dependent oxidoreductase (luciferase family)
LGRLKFGVFLPFYAFKAIEPKEHFSLIRDITLECEHLGYHSVWFDDHLMYSDWPIFESWTTISALSSLTSKIRLGTMVFCDAHRNPALLAKMTATLDVISGGRLELGMGAGAQGSEHTSYGFGFPKPSIRIERLGEALNVIRSLWTQDKANFQGKHYSLTDAICEPKPLQKPYPPITVGGSGELLMQKVTAPYANRFDWGFLPSIEEYKSKLEFLDKQCAKIGRNFDEIEKSCWPGGQVLIAKNQRELDEKISRCKPANVSLENFKKTATAATSREFVERLKVYSDLGVSYFMLFFGDLPSLEGIRQFSKEVISELG